MDISSVQDTLDCVLHSKKRLCIKAQAELTNVIITDDIEIATEINLLHNKNSVLDIFNISIIKYIKDEIIPALVRIFNKSITEGTNVKDSQNKFQFLKRGMTSFQAVTDQ